MSVGNMLSYVWGLFADVGFYVGDIFVSIADVFIFVMIAFLFVVFIKYLLGGD